MSGTLSRYANLIRKGDVMAEQRSSETSDEAPMPKWVYVVGVVVILAAVIFVGMHLAGGGMPSHLPAQ
jgi:uncharacterized membrane protein